MKLRDIGLRLALEEWAGPPGHEGPAMAWWYGKHIYVVLSSTGISLAARKVGLGISECWPSPRLFTAERLRQLDADIAAGGDAKAIAIFYNFMHQVKGE